MQFHAYIHMRVTNFPIGAPCPRREIYDDGGGDVPPTRMRPPRAVGDWERCCAEYEDLLVVCQTGLLIFAAIGTPIESAELTSVAANCRLDRSPPVPLRQMMLSSEPNARYSSPPQ